MMRAMPESTLPPDAQAFLEAIKAAKHDEVLAALEEHPEYLDLRDPTEFGATILGLCVWFDDLPLLEKLIERGADVDAASDWEAGPWPPMQLALCLSRDAFADALVEHGAHIGPHEAAGLGRLNQLREILDEDPEAVNQRGGDGCYPLHFANGPAIVDLLLERGADIEGRDLDHNSTPLHYLCAYRPETAIYLMDQGAEPNVFSIIAAGDIERLRKIIENDPAQLRYKLDEALFPPHPETGAINIMNFSVGFHSTPLHAAARSNRPEVIAMLLDAGLDVNQRGDYDDCTPLHTAAWHDLTSAAEELLKRGAQIDIESGKLHENTPAGWAIVAGSENVLRLLFDAGAEVRPYYLRDAEAAAAGAFRQYKPAPQAAYDRVLEMVRKRSENS